MRFTKFCALMMIALAGGCHDGSEKSADKAANKLVDQTDKLRNTEAQLDHLQHDKLADREQAVAQAEDEFATRRELRIDTLTAEQSVIASQQSMIETLAGALPLTEVGRNNVGEKLAVFKLRLTAAATDAQALQGVPAEEFVGRDQAATESMRRVDEARKLAWKALADAPRITDTSSLEPQRTQALSHGQRI